MTNEELSKSLSNCIVKIPYLNLIHLSKVFFITNVTYLLQTLSFKTQKYIKGTNNLIKFKKTQP